MTTISNVGVICNKACKGFWWGEGEVKMYLDGDKDYPIGTAWGYRALMCGYLIYNTEWPPANKIIILFPGGQKVLYKT